MVLRNSGRVGSRRFFLKQFILFAASVSGMRRRLFCVEKVGKEAMGVYKFLHHGQVYVDEIVLNP